MPGTSPYDSLITDPAEQAALSEKRDEETVTLGHFITRIGRLPKLHRHADRSRISGHIHVLSGGSTDCPPKPEAPG